MVWHKGPQIALKFLPMKRGLLWKFQINSIYGYQERARDRYARVSLF